jgi:hypothetical protein
MAKNYHIKLEVKRLQDNLVSDGFEVKDCISNRGVPYLLVEGKVSLCFFWRTKQWKAFDWLSADNRTLTQKSPADIQDFIKGYFKKERNSKVLDMYEMFVDVADTVVKDNQGG